MTYEELMKANAEIKTTDIKGKDYAEVNQRIKAFRMLFPNGCIQTSIQSIENGICVIKAMIFDEEMKLIGTGHAYEKENSTFINKTSYIENCETSAVGRALGMCGIGIDTSVASYEEVSNAIAQQDQDEKKTEEVKNSKPSTAHIKTIQVLAENKGYSEANICNLYGKKKFADMTFEEWNDACTKLNKYPDKEAK